MISRQAQTEEEKKPFLVAIYTRKSNDENLMGEVTSLDTQRGACRAYIQIQKAKGWQEYREGFDDPNESGKDLRRPSVKRLIKAVEEGRVHGVIVYKLDRLTRNKRDFDNLLDLFEKHNVALISATESIDTKSPQGRLMVAILMQFAQYDRELDQERSKDFHLARAKKGLWCGGLAPLGYDLKEKLLAVNEAEAQIVRRVFDLYLEHKSSFRVAYELERLGLRRKRYTTQKGKTIGGQPFDPDTVTRILQRKVYIGIVTNERTRQEFPGQHQSLITQRVFDAAQRLLKDHTIREAEIIYGANKHGFLFKGLIRCGECRSAVVGYVQPRKRKVYRYYKCIAKANGLPSKCAIGKSFGAQKLEEYVIEKLAVIGYNRPLLERVVQKIGELSRRQLEPLEKEKRDIQKRLDSIQQQIRNLLDLVRDHGSNEEASKELRRLGTAKAELDGRVGELEAKIGGRKQPVYNVDVIQGTLQRFANFIYKIPVDLRVQAIRVLVKQVTVFKDRTSVELHKLPIADLQRALNVKIDKGPPFHSTNPIVQERREPNVKAAKRAEGTGLQELSKTGGDGGSKPLKSQFPPLFQTPETDEIIHYLPSFALDWALVWGRITNGERVIEDAPTSLEFVCLPFPTVNPAQNLANPGVHERWEQTINPATIHQVVPHAS